MTSATLVAALLTTIQLTPPCTESRVISMEAAGRTVGEATVSFLESKHVPYIGNEAGMNSIFATPTGTDAIEVISDTEMRAYGWCFEVDGVQPSLMPDKVSLDGVKYVRWFYGSARYSKGKWVSYCDPTSVETPPQFCGDELAGH